MCWTNDQVSRHSHKHKHIMSHVTCRIYITCHTSITCYMLQSTCHTAHSTQHISHSNLLITPSLIHHLLSNLSNSRKSITSPPLINLTYQSLFLSLSLSQHVLHRERRCVDGVYVHPTQGAAGPGGTRPHPTLQNETGGWTFHTSISIIHTL